MFMMHGHKSLKTSWCVRIKRSLTITITIQPTRMHLMISFRTVTYINILILANEVTCFWNLRGAVVIICFLRSLKLISTKKFHVYPDFRVYGLCEKLICLKVLVTFKFKALNTFFLITHEQSLN